MLSAFEIYQLALPAVFAESAGGSLGDVLTERGIVVPANECGESPQSYESTLDSDLIGCNCQAKPVAAPWRSFNRSAPQPAPSIRRGDVGMQEAMNILKTALRVLMALLISASQIPPTCRNSSRMRHSFAKCPSMK